MKYFEKETEELKKYIKKKYPKSLEYNIDCDDLAAHIREATERSISASTLKRLFGFVRRTSNFSKHTYDTLAIYVGFKNWEHFVNKGKVINQPQLNHDLWNSIKRGANKITDYSLKTVRECSGIDYDKTIERQFFEKRFEEFYHSDKSAMALIAPAGYGKSILTTRLIDKYFWSTGKQAKFSKDIIWFINASVIANQLSENYTMKQWIFDQMGYDDDTDILTILSNNPEFRLGKLILYIDDVNETSFQGDIWNKFLDELLATLSKAITIDWYKVVINARPKAWVKICDAMANVEPLRNAWFKTPMATSAEESINLPVLNESEILNIAKKLSIEDRIKWLYYNNPEIFKIIRYPLALQLYSDIDDAKKKYTSKIDIYNEFIHKKIVSESRGEEKLEIINRFIEISELGLKGSGINLEEILPLKNKYTKAYNELISYGILYEYKELSEYLSLKKYVKFQAEGLFEFLIVNYWLRNNNLDYKLFAKVQKYYKGHELEINIIKLLIEYAFYKQKTELLKQIYEFMFPYYKKFLDSEGENTSGKTEIFELGFYVGTALRNYDKMRKKLIPHFAKDPYAQKLYFEYYNDRDSINLHYGDNMDIYLQNADNVQMKQYGYASKLFQYIMAADKIKCRKVYNQMAKKELDQITHPFYNGYRDACLLLYHHFCKQEIPEKLIKKIVEKEKEMPRDGKLSNNFPHYHYQLIEILTLCEDYESVIKLAEIALNDFTSKYPYMVYLDKMLNNYYANALLMTGDSAEAYKFFTEIDSETIPIFRRKFGTIMYKLCQFNFLIHEKKIEKAKALVKDIKHTSEMLRFDFFEKYLTSLRKKYRATSG